MNKKGQINKAQKHITPSIIMNQSNWVGSHIIGDWNPDACAAPVRTCIDSGIQPEDLKRGNLIVSIVRMFLLITDLGLLRFLRNFFQRGDVNETDRSTV